jgi:hypothetical protein
VAAAVPLAARLLPVLLAKATHAIPAGLRYAAELS